MIGLRDSPRLWAGTEPTEWHISMVIEATRFRLLRSRALMLEMGLVGLAIAEYMPWEAIATRKLLRKLLLLAG